MSEDSLPAVARRLLRYARYDTQSAEDSDSVPSTAKQLDLLVALVEELKELGVTDAAMDEHHYVIGTVPANVDHPVPVIGLIAHVDTSPELTGEGVRPRIHRNYDGGPIALSAQYTLTPEQSPELLAHRGHTIITTDGTTLLGADNKAGIAEIMTLVEGLRADPSIPHGEIRVAFTFDEEIGRGTEHFDVNAFGAQYAYTVDGETVGQIENETFCADSATVTFTGVNVHPGYAKDRMVNSLRAAADFIGRLPPGMSPECTEGRQGYLHPTQVQGGVEQTTVKLILRDFQPDQLVAYRRLLREYAAAAEAAVPGSKVQLAFDESYRNMRLVLDEHPTVVECALEATRRAGIEPELSQIRGGTDGANLSFAGLPTPNIFTGGHLFHSRFEWIAVEGMEATVRTLEELVKVWAERGQRSGAGK